MNQNLIALVCVIICLKKDGTYVINLDDYADVDTHLIILYVLNNDAIYLIALEFNMFLKKLDVLLVIKTCKRMYSECKQIIQSSMVIFALDLLIRKTFDRVIPILFFFHLMILKKKEKLILRYFKNG